MTFRVLFARMIVVVCGLALALALRASGASVFQNDSGGSCGEVTRPVPLSTRMGYGVSRGGFGTHPETNSLRAGVYLHWDVRIEPERPLGIEFIQTVRLHQDLTQVDPNQAESCELKSQHAHDRMICPYKQPHSYTFSPDAATIQEAAYNNPGSTWLIGNEIERKDWPLGGQDEILPELYAEAYYELYHLIKAADPSAMIANGGMVQVTPLRLQYLTRIWDAYKTKFGTDMPVDVWNTHVFILPEKLDEWGADIPVGIDETEGAYLFNVDEDSTLKHPVSEYLNTQFIEEQVLMLRQWMKDRGQQEKPLIISEYGILLHNENLGAPNDDPQVVIDFMLATFDYFLHTKDCNLGYPADACRLVQKWIWYSFDDTIFNEFQKLMDPHTSQLTQTGKAFRQYSLQNLQLLSEPPYQAERRAELCR